MKRLISIELQKIWKNKASRFLTLTYFLLLSLISVIASIKLSIFGFEISIADQGIFNFPYIWQVNTWTALWFKLFLSIVVVSMVANEYTYGTLKQNLIDGLSKKEFIVSKFFTIVLFSVISTIFIFVISLCLGLAFSSYTEIDIILTDLEYLIAYFVNLIGFFSFCLFVGILIKRSAFALGFLFLWFIFEVVLEYWIFPMLLRSKSLASQIIDFFPLESLSNLIKEPISRFQAYKAIESQITQNALSKDYAVHWYELLIALAWTVIFVLSSYKLLQKRDL